MLTTPVHRLFESHAAQTPDAVALLGPRGPVTYADLNARANRLAHLLLARGVQPGTPVALCLERSSALIVALLAILKTGACYVPLDPLYPADRLRIMAADSGATLILATRDLASSLPAASTILFLDDLPLHDHPADNLPVDVPATAPAYIMFTSGSTGRPKGVAIPHRAIVRLVRDQDYVNFSGETFLQFAPISFDASTLEIWGPLLNGARTAIAAPGALSLDQIAEAIRYMAVTSLWLTSGLFNLIVDEKPDAFAPLRQLLAGGDVLSIPHVRKVMAAHPKLRLINGYGPTETTTFACCHTISPSDLDLPSIPIGKPIAHTTIRILDDSLAPVPDGDPGELYIGGDGLALGYWNQPTLTAEKFIDLAGEKFYRTGDRVRLIPENGVIEFLGRQDQQVKIRGFRIELSEIESVLSRQPGVDRCVVITLGDGPDKTLAAYHTGPADPAALRAALRSALPDHMVPSFFTPLPSLPLTENGKVDRARLPSPFQPLAFSLHTSPTPPRTDLERSLSALWSQILSLPTPDLNANFFDIGGTSLKLVEAHSRLVRTLRRQIPVTALFQYPTIASLAAFLSQDTANREAPPSGFTAAADRARMQRAALAKNKPQRPR